MKIINSQRVYFFRKVEAQKYLSGFPSKTASSRVVKNLVCFCSEELEALKNNKITVKKISFCNVTS